MILFLTAILLVVVGFAAGFRFAMYTVNKCLMEPTSNAQQKLRTMIAVKLLNGKDYKP